MELKRKFLFLGSLVGTEKCKVPLQYMDFCLIYLSRLQAEKNMFTLKGF